MEGVSQALNAATCYAFMRRAKFKPAEDESGNPKESDYVGSVSWVLPEPDSRGNRR